MHTYKLGSFPLEQVADPEALSWKIGQLLASFPFPWRQIAWVRPFNMDAPITRVQGTQRQLQRLSAIVDPLLLAIDGLLSDSSTDPAALVASWNDATRTLVLDALHEARPDSRALIDGSFAGPATEVAWADLADDVSRVLWPLPWQSETVRYLTAKAEHQARVVDHYLITWDSERSDSRAIQTQLEATIGRPVEAISGLPSILQSTYTEELTRFAPTDAGYPYCAVVHSCEWHGEWMPQTIGELLRLPCDVSVVLDVHTLPRAKARRTAELAYAASRTLAQDGDMLDTRAEHVVADAQRVLHELTVQALHLVTCAVLVFADSEAALEEHVSTVRTQLGSNLRFTRVPGVQGEVLKLWSQTPTRKLDAPLKPHNMLSEGVGCLSAGLLGFHSPSDSDGVLWAIDQQRGAPLFRDPFQHNQANHMVIVGTTGYGKTFFANTCCTIRSAAIERWKVIGIDAFRNCDRIERAAGEGMRSNLIGLQSSINLLDIVYAADTADGWLGNQVQHVIGNLSLLLGEDGVDGDNNAILLPRRFSIPERGLLDEALSKLYAPLSPHTPLAEMPILGDLIGLLEQLNEPESTSLARDLDLFLRGSLGKSFNAPTAIDFTIERDITYFDFKDVTAKWRPFYYAVTIGAIGRWMRDPRRDLRRPTLLVIDEFHYVSRVEAVARMAVEIAKTARKYRLGLVVIDQNPGTFLDSLSGQFIWENSGTKVLFHLDAVPARRLGEAIPELTPSHVEFLTVATPGQGVMVFGNDVYETYVEPNARELRYLRGS